MLEKIAEEIRHKLSKQERLTQTILFTCSIVQVTMHVILLVTMLLK